MSDEKKVSSFGVGDFSTLSNVEFIVEVSITQIRAEADVDMEKLSDPIHST